MYAVKVTGACAAVTPAPDSSSVGGSSSSKSQTQDCATERLNVSCGAKGLEVVNGYLHLFRETTATQQENSHLTLPQGRRDQVCLLGLPFDMCGPQICSFLGGFLEHVREIRIVRREPPTVAAPWEATTTTTTTTTTTEIEEADEGGEEVEQKEPHRELASNQNLALIRLTNAELADEFHAAYNGVLYSNLEEDVCQVVFVEHAEFSDTVETQYSPTSESVLAPAGMTELPTCPVCLERLDQHISGVMTTVCNHTFHSDCLRKWGDASCPVCRYCEKEAHEAPTCMVCGATDQLWMCLICGHVGCGRDNARHAVQHWHDTQHCYALELETKHVWDYVGDNYVHRLIQTSQEGKLVELSTPHNHRGRNSCGDSAHPGEQELNEALVESKMDSLAYDFNHLLTTQLDSQRNYFEGLLAEARHEKQQECDELEQKLKEVSSDLERHKQKLGKKVELLSEQVKSITEERDFLKSINESLVSNQKTLQNKLEAAKGAATAIQRDKNTQIQSLEEQVRDLMVYIEAEKTLHSSEMAAELQHGSVSVGASPPPAPEPSASPSRRRRLGRR